MLDSCIELLTPVTAQIDSIEKETERAAMLTKRMMETPLLEPPTMMEPTLKESEQASSKRRRRTRYTPLPGIMENAVYLAPSAWLPFATRLTLRGHFLLTGDRFDVHSVGVMV